MPYLNQEYILPEANCPPGQLFPDAKDIFLNDPLADCMRVGVGTTIVDGTGRILMLAHKESDKCIAGELGPMTETVQWSAQDNVLTAETTLETMARATREELLVDNPNRLQLSARRHDGWFMDKVPVGKNHPGQYILAICTVIHMPTHRAERLVDGFTSTDDCEIEQLTLMRPDEIVANSKLRPLADRILEGVFRRHLDRPLRRADMIRLNMPLPQSLQNASDNIPPRELRLVG